MIGLTVQNFVSAATGMAVLVAFIRGLARRTADTIGNFWVDLVRSTLYILLPLSLIFAVVLVSQGVVQNFQPYKEVTLVQATQGCRREAGDHANLADGTGGIADRHQAARHERRRVLQRQSAHPYENPTPLSNFLELLAILLIPAALCYTFGMMVGDPRQGWAILAAMFVIFVPLAIGCIAAEEAGNPALTALGVDQTRRAMQAGGNMEGKEVRFGIASSATVGRRDDGGLQRQRQFHA